jgi:hypothetical protein
MFINLKKLKAPEIRKLAKAYNKLNSIPHPSTLKKDELIKYLIERLETNNRGFLNIDSLHPKLKKSIQHGIDRISKLNEEAKQNFELTIKEIEDDIKKNKKPEEKFVPYRDTLTKEQREEQDKRFKYFIETGKFYPSEIKETPRSKKEIEREKAIVKQLEEERKEKEEARIKRNEKIMKEVREKLKEKEAKKTKKPTKKPKPQEPIEDDDDVEEDPETKKMALYFQTIKDPKQRMKEVREYIMSKQKKN